MTAWVVISAIGMAFVLWACCAVGGDADRQAKAFFIKSGEEEDDP